MFNQELKTRFIRSYTQSLSTAQHATTIFNAFEPYETEWGEDLCTKQANELQPIVNELVGMRYKSRWMAISILREYTRWCVVTKVPGACDGMAHIEVDGLDKVRRQMVSGPLHLQKYLNAVFDKEEEETIDNLYRCFYWMAYAGIDEEDALLITKDDVNLDTLSINYRGDRVSIYREAIPAFRNAVFLTDFSYKHPNYAKTIRRERVPGDTLMRGIKANTKLMTIRSTLSHRSKEAVEKGLTDLQLSFYRIWISGLFYRMYERERAGDTVDFSEAAIRYMSGKAYKGRTVTTKMNLVARDYMEDYQRWKLAFPT